ncbi:BrnT family toxin [Microvirga aerilata]|uniref:BrnT family toxin n=1 Tax=Microvirga aerilata TaxID=670292 RepID=A0A936ZDL1_9HYPH|nr:BrnT family toxin [Microvirga aerilata]MBL0408277.1 BrnT family toxin [Microvirga aerilata]
MDAAAEFEWDDAKASANEAKHSVRFDYAAAVFLDDDRLDLDTTRADDGEERRKAIELIDGKLYTVVYTLRGSVCRLISARRSNAKESRSYGYHAQDP